MSTALRHGAATFWLASCWHKVENETHLSPFKSGCDDVNFFSFCRRGALTGMLLLLGITSAQGGGLAAPVTDSYGTHTLPSQPLRIVSTSVTLTGSLLGD